jgi:hypothetical protein
MCHESVIDFGKSVLRLEHLHKKDVVEVGSRNVNGSLREYVEQFKPHSYLGLDLIPGPGVDMLVDICNIPIDRFPPSDLVICTEMLEHVKSWKSAVFNIKRLCKVGGYVLLTTRSEGFKKHEYPGDYWRFSILDMTQMFADFEIKYLKPDPQAPGVHLFAKRITDEVEYANMAGNPTEVK